MKQGEDILKFSEIKVILYGVGSIGSSIARLLLTKRGVKIVGAIDAASGKVGKDLGDVIGADKPLGVPISNNLDQLLTEVKADIAIHATSSFLKDVYPQLVELIQYGLDVVSTCEELSYPYISYADLAMELDRLAKGKSVTVLGTGINPGFLMDALPIMLTGVCQEVRHIKVERLMDAGRRRLPFQKKIGVGLTVEAFEEKIEKGDITGHVGLKESIAMIASALGWRLQSIELGKVEPVIAKKSVKNKEKKVEVGHIAGLRQAAYGIMSEKPIIILVFKAYIGAKEEYDSVTIEGIPTIHEKITPCVHGDLGTAAIIFNSIPKVINASPGLKTMKDLPIPSAVLGEMRQYIGI